MGILTWEVLNTISLLSSCLPVSPYGPSCLSLDGCSPCPCQCSLWALASPTLRTKASTWLQETLTFFSCGECVGEEERRHLILKQPSKTESELIYCREVYKCASSSRLFIHLTFKKNLLHASKGLLEAPIVKRTGVTLFSDS